ncbi:hypothetical protein DFH28DRAFT_1123177 [Melampsora americana]|nr:hypothetical protein DFH28DRAFT_1123177 [Melampsora americana]
MDIKVLPLTSGYNPTQWNAEFDSLNSLVQARKVVSTLLAKDLDHVRATNRHTKALQKP